MAETQVKKGQVDEKVSTDIKNDGTLLKADSEHLNFQLPLSAADDGVGVSVAIGSIAGLSGLAGDPQTPTTHGNTKHSPAMLENAPNKFNAFTEKALPVDADVILIEDSAAAFAKKKSLLSNLPGLIFGSDFQYIDDDANDPTSWSSDQNWQQKVRLSFTPASTGDYIIIGYCETTNSNNYNEVTARLWQDSISELAYSAYEPEDSNYFQSQLLLGPKVTLTAAPHTFDIEFSRMGGTAQIRRARIFAWRIA